MHRSRGNFHLLSMRLRGINSSTYHCQVHSHAFTPKLLRIPIKLHAYVTRTVTFPNSILNSGLLKISCLSWGCHQGGSKFSPPYWKLFCSALDFLSCWGGILTKLLWGYVSAGSVTIPSSKSKLVWEPVSKPPPLQVIYRHYIYTI